MTTFELISTQADPAVQRIKDLNKRQHHSVKTILVEDYEPLLQAISSDVDFIELYALESIEFPEQLVQVAQAKNIPMRKITRELSKQIFPQDKRPRLFGIAKVPYPATFKDLESTTGDILVLDGVRIAGNIGAIIRTAYALGADGIVLVDSGLDTIADRRLVRASRGYVFSLPIVIASEQEAGDYIRPKTVVAFDTEGSDPIATAMGGNEQLIMLFGSERNGASEGLTSLATHTVSFPMRSSAESLNVSVTVGIALSARAGHNLSRH